MLLKVNNSYIVDCGDLRKVLDFLEEQFGFSFRDEFEQTIDDYVKNNEEITLKRDEMVVDLESESSFYYETLQNTINDLQEVLDGIKKKEFPFSQKQVIPRLESIISNAPL